MASKKPELDVIIDSGAYSAWRLGKAIDLPAYCDYIEANHAWIGSYIALDVINPGNPEEAAAASFKNLKYMRKRGLNPMAVWHASEGISWLHRMLDIGCDYIGLAGSSLASRQAVNDWYAWAFSHLVNDNGDAIVKTHALGEGRINSLNRFPWYSADSTSWIYAAQRNGKATLSTGSHISMRHDGGGNNSAPDLENLSQEDRIQFDSLMAVAGIDPAAFVNRDKVSTILRTYLTAIYYLQLQEKVRALQPIKFHPHGFLHNGYSEVASIPQTKFKMHLVAGNNDYGWACLARLGYEYTLASYYYITGGGKILQYNGLQDWVMNPIHYMSITAREKTREPWQILEKYTK